MGSRKVLGDPILACHTSFVQMKSQFQNALQHVIIVD